MKKVLFFAIALVASALVFTSCEKNSDNPLVGTWQYIEDYGPDRTEKKVIFEGSNKFTYSEYMYLNDQVHYGYMYKGTYKIDGDMVYVHYTGFMSTIDGEMHEHSDFEPYDDQFKYSIDGKTLTITYLPGTGSDYTETYTKQ